MKMFLLVRPSLEMSMLDPEGYTAATETAYCVSGCSLDSTALVFLAPICSCHRVTGSQVLLTKVGSWSRGSEVRRSPSRRISGPSGGMKPAPDTRARGSSGPPLGKAVRVSIKALKW